jgi:hypothetical protein
MKKKIITSVLALGLVAGIAYAHGSGFGMGGYGNGGHMMNYGMNNGMGSGPMMNGGYNMMGHHMRGSGYANCPGAAAFNNNGWDSASHQKFLNDTVELRQEMNDKRFEYMEARRNPNAGRDQLAAIEKELNDLQLRLQQKAQQYR